jgi:hypothetical protein
MVFHSGLAAKLSRLIVNRISLSGEMLIQQTAMPDRTHMCEPFARATVKGGFL